MTAVGIGYGATFWLANSSGTLTKLSEIISITPPNPQTDDVEATHMESPNRRKEYIAGLIEDGNGTFEMNWVPGSATDQLIVEAQNSGTVRSYKIVLALADGSFQNITGSAIVKGYERQLPIADRMTGTLTVRFTGASTQAVGA